MALPLKLKDFGDIGNVIAAIGVIISLLVVAWEIRGNTNALQADARLQMVELNRQSLDWYRDPNLVDILNRGASDLGALDAIESQQFRASAIGTFDMWEQGYFLHRDGLISDDVWNSWNRGMTDLTSSMGHQAIWGQMRNYFSQEFRTFVDREHRQE